MRRFLTLRGWPVAIAAVVWAVVWGLLGNRAAWADDAPQDRFRQAVELQMRGQSDEGAALLKTLLADHPDYAPARWQSGFVKSDGDWVGTERIEERARANDALQEYRRRRDELSGAPWSADLAAAHMGLANWCRKHDLPEEQRVHLLAAVWLDSRYLPEAARRLGLRTYKGQLLTGEQLAASKARDARLERDFQRWRPQLAGIRQAMKRGGPSEASARERLLQIDDPACIPAVESLTLPSGRRDRPLGDAASFDWAVVELLGRFSEHDATASLARHAVLSESNEVRTGAAKELRPRSWHEFVPILLFGFGWPVELSYQAGYLPGAEFSALSFRWLSGRYAPGTELYSELVPPQSTFSATLLREGPGGTLEQSFTASTKGFVSPNHDATRLFSDSQRLERTIAAFNARLPERNERVARALGTATGVTLNHGWDSTSDEPTTDPDAWYRWWSKYNESYVPEEKPYIRLASWSDYRGLWADGFAMVSLSCFPRGAEVATISGPARIESIQIGDRVLSQDLDTGELCYKPVLGTTVRPPAALLEIVACGDTLRCTRGHPFWVVGQGWRMAKELKAGDRLWAVGRTVTVESVTPIDQSEEAFNLIVGDFNTYFVGPNRVLVHDNTPQRPTRVVLPGFVPVGRAE